MQVIKQGTAYVMRGTCESCGCEITFTDKEATQITPHCPWHTSLHYVDCPTKGCNDLIFQEKPAQRKATFIEKIFGCIRSTQQTILLYTEHSYRSLLMGDVADMMLEGILCQECGVYVGEGVGYPVSCHYCQRRARFSSKPTEKQTCPVCSKKVRGLEDHIRDAHGGTDV